MNDLILKHKEQFDVYYKFLIEENEKYNLTAITKESEVYIKHFLDSIMLGKYLDFTKTISICDVGSGAGFPIIPLKICYPNIKATIIEPTKKKALFMEEVIRRLSLKDINVICARAEDIALVNEEKYDIIVARAVANLPILLELLMRFAKVNGIVVAYKGDKGAEEVLDSKNALKQLSGEIEKVYEYDLPDNMGKRNLIVIKKVKKTSSKYPRRYAEIKKKPL